MNVSIRIATDDTVTQVTGTIEDKKQFNSAFSNMLNQMKITKRDVKDRRNVNRLVHQKSGGFIRRLLGK